MQILFIKVCADIESFQTSYNFPIRVWMDIFDILQIVPLKQNSSQAFRDLSFRCSASNRLFELFDSRMQNIKTLGLRQPRIHGTSKLYLLVFKFAYAISAFMVRSPSFYFGLERPLRHSKRCNDQGHRISDF